VDNHLLREIRVLEGPEAEQTWLELAVINAVNVELTIANSNKVRIGLIDIDAGYLATFCDVALKCEKGFEANFTLFDFNFFFLLFALFLGLFLHAHATLLLLTLFFVISEVSVAKFDRWVVLVEDVLLVVSILGQQTLNNLDGLHDGFRKFFLDDLSGLLNCTVRPSHRFTADWDSLGLTCALIRNLLRSLTLVYVSV